VAGRIVSLDLEWVARELGRGGSVTGFLERNQQRLCEAFGADRITVYKVVRAERATLVSIFQRGIGQFTPIQVPLLDNTIAGHAAVHRKLLNISDCYDEKELAALNPPAAFLRAVDERTGYRTRQLLTAPILSSLGGNTVGVVQVLNRLDGARFPAECEQGVRRLCEHLSRALTEELSAERRNPFAPDRTTLPEELLAIPELMARAEGGFREDAPADAAHAREQLLQLYRNAFNRRPSLDPYETGQKMVRVAGSGDVRALEWLCRLAAAGHLGADRLLDRVLVLGERWSYDNSRTWISWPTGLTPAAVHVKVLANRYPKVARALARQECESPDRDVTVLLDWLELGGKACQSLADAIREIFPPPEPIDVFNFGIVARHIGLATRGGETGDHAAAGDLFAEIALDRLRSTNLSAEQRARAMALLERAEALGSFRGCAELWFAKRADAADPQAFVRDWMTRNPDPASAPTRVAVAIGVALERGELGAPPDREAALRWYVPHITFRKEIDPRPPYDQNPDVCTAVAGLLNSGPDRDLSRAWHERAIAFGSETSTLLLLLYWSRGDAEAADLESRLRELRAFYASTYHPMRPREAEIRNVLRRSIRSCMERDPARRALWEELADFVEARATSEKQTLSA
jgi:TPR repeat protein